MKVKLLSAFVFLALVLSGCIAANGNNGIGVDNGKDSDATVKKVVSISSFDEISVSQGIKVIVSQGAFTGKAEVATTPSAEKYLKVKVSGGKLRIYYENNGGNQNAYQVKGPSIVTLTVPNLEEVEVSSGASFNLKGKFRCNDKMEFNLSSGSSTVVDGLDCSKLSVNASSAATAKFGRVSANLDAETSSSSSLTIEALKGDMLEFSTSSGSSIKAGSAEGKKMEFGSSSASSISLKTAVADNMEFDTSSASKIKIDSVRSKAIRATASSGSSITLAGTTGSIDKNASSAAKINVSGLTVK